MMGWYAGGGPGWAGWVLMTVFMLAFWGLLVVGGLALYKSLRRASGRGYDDGPRAQRLLDERLARGEIDVEEYLKRRDVLHGGR